MFDVEKTYFIASELLFNTIANFAINFNLFIELTLHLVGNPAISCRVVVVT